MIQVNPDLRVILMSATIDTTLFSKYFHDCPVIEVVGSAYHVKEYFLEDCIEVVPTSLFDLHYKTIFIFNSKM